MPRNQTGQFEDGIGSLRWVVMLYRRDQAPGPNNAIAEDLVPIATVHADIQPARTYTFYQSTQVDMPFTHTIAIRWQNYPSTIDVIERTTDLPDTTLRGELYRVRRTLEVGGRKRFLLMECELEHARAVPDDTLGTANALLTEPYDGAGAAPPGVNPL